jgi:hypothetical protein
MDQFAPLIAHIRNYVPLDGQVAVFNNKTYM